MLDADLTSVTLGTIFAEIAEDNMKKVLDWFQQMAVLLESGVQSVGPAANYSLVWEWGNSRQTKKGPKTTKGTNPDGKRVWLSIQAPKGWISIHESKIYNIISEEINKVEFESFSDITEDSLKQQLNEAYDRIAQRSLELLQSTVPIDSGDLYDSLEVISVDNKVQQGIDEISESIINEIGTLNL